MLTYQNTFNPPKAVDDTQRAAALSGLRGKNPYAAYGQQGQDIMAAMGDQNAAQYNLAADRANADMEQKQVAAQRDFALQGLQQMSQARQNQADYANARSAMGYGLVSNLLSGLFR